MICVLAWLAWGILSGLPLTGHLYFGSKSHIQKRACLTYNLQTAAFGPWQYALVVFGLGNAAALLICIHSCWGIYRYISDIQHHFTTPEHHATKMIYKFSVVRKLVQQVIPSLLCWLVILLVMLESVITGTQRQHLALIMAIFILPINSVINPFLHTIHTLIPGP